MPYSDPATALPRLINDIAECDHARELGEAFVRYCAALNAEHVSYHRTIRNLRSIPLWDGFELSTFPDDWVKLYSENGWFDYDPIIQTAATVTQPFRWFDVARMIRLEPRQVAFLDQVRAYGFTDGFAVPVFSAHGTTGYFGVGTSRGKLKLDAGGVMMLQMACQAVHEKSLQLDDIEDGLSDLLTARETEVLTGVAKGRGNAEIAADLAISERTVDTLLRRAFDKLEVSDRVSASVKAIGMGLIRL
jgi:DNA-binding CsgD family transcriptional regulator